MKLLLLFLATLLMVGCDIAMDDDSKATNTAEVWADAYFNCDYKEAQAHVTLESRKWLQFAASNITEQDLNLLQESGGARVTVQEGFDVANDTLRMVTMTVTNYLKPEVVGQAATLEREGIFKVIVVKRNTGWQVRMAGLPRSERQSRD